MMAAVSDILILQFAALHLAAFTGRNQEATSGDDRKAMGTKMKPGTVVLRTIA